MGEVTTKPTKNINVTIDTKLALEAREAGINFSQTLAKAVRAELKSLAAERWKHENADAIDYLNQLSDEHGLFSDEHRTF